jgi:hypothetical protein
VISLEVNAAGIATLEFKRDAPRPIHMDRIERGFEASQSMKIKPGDVHFLRHPSGREISASIFDVRPFSQSSATGLLLKLLTMLLATTISYMTPCALRRNLRSAPVLRRR